MLSSMSDDGYSAVIDDFGNIIVVRITGDFRINMLENILDLMEKRLDKGVAVFALDFSRVGCIDSSGLGILVQYQKRLRRMGIPLVITEMSPEIQKILGVAKLDSLIDTMTRSELSEIYPCISCVPDTETTASDHAPGS